MPTTLGRREGPPETARVFVPPPPAIGELKLNRYAFFFLMSDAPERIQEVVHLHYAYWEELGMADCAGGPFADRSGGLITFSAASDADAKRIVDADPFVDADVIETRWLKQWVPV